MAHEHHLDEKKGVRARPSREQKPPQKADGQPQRALSTDDLRRPDVSALQRMQRTVGNAAVQRFLARRQATGEAAVDEESAATINRARGGGAPLDGRMADRAGQVMGYEFDEVRVHTGAEADRLSRRLGARAFTTGQDIFFRDGAYAPGSRDGQELLAHELTHVVQQRGQVPEPGSEMVVNEPGDVFETEADAVAATVLDQAPAPAPQAALREEEETVQRQEEEELLQMQPMEEEEEMLQMQEDEEEMLQMQEDEEEMLQMQPLEEEEEELLA